MFQALRNATPIHEYFSSLPVGFVESSSLGDDASLAYSFITDFQNVVSESSDSEKPAHRLSATIDNIRTRPSGVIKGFNEQDAHEFLHTLLSSVAELEEVMEPILQNVPKEESLPPLKKTLTGRTRVRLICQKCSDTRGNEESWTSLSLPVLQEKDLSSMIESQFEKETLLDGSDSLFCSKCQNVTPTVRSYSILEGPEVLIVQLQNAEFTSQGMRKTDHTVHIPEVFGIMDESKSVCAYDLSGTDVHIGSNVYSGHYVAYHLRQMRPVCVLMMNRSTSFHQDVVMGICTFRSPMKRYIF